MPAVQVECRPAMHEFGQEWLIWLTVPAAGGDGILLGAVESEQAARAISQALQNLIECCHSHPRPSALNWL